MTRLAIVWHDGICGASASSTSPEGNLMERWSAASRDELKRRRTDLALALDDLMSLKRDASFGGAMSSTMRSLSKAIDSFWRCQSGSLRRSFTWIWMATFHLTGTNALGRIFQLV